MQCEIMFLEALKHRSKVNVRPKIEALDCLASANVFSTNYVHTTTSSGIGEEKKNNDKTFPRLYSVFEFEAQNLHVDKTEEIQFTFSLFRGQYFNH